MACEAQRFGRVIDDIGGDGWVMGYLLYEQRRCATRWVRSGGWPDAVESFTEDRVEGSVMNGRWLEREGLQGVTNFFSEPISSLRLVYWSFKVLMNHRRTARARSWPDLASAMAAK